MQQPSPTGVLIDNRDDFEKSKDYKHEEIAMGFSPYVWEERPYKPKYFFRYNQASSLSCVAGGAVATIEFYDGIVGSRKDVYGRRINYPYGGMFMDDLFKIMREGIAREETVKSQGLGEVAMNERYPITEQVIADRAKYRTGLSFDIQAYNNIDTIASIVKVCPVVAFWYFDEGGREWWKEYPTVMFNFPSYIAPGTTRHQVVIVDAILIGGKKYLVGQDTAGVGSGLGENGNLRLISEDMVKKRLYSAGYCLDDSNEVIVPNPVQKPVYANSVTLKVGSSGKAVTDLQSVLIYEGLLKIKAPTGVFAGLTRKAVIALQEKYRDQILKPAGLKVGTGIVASLTNKFLNEKYK